MLGHNVRAVSEFLYTYNKKMLGKCPVSDRYLELCNTVLKITWIYIAFCTKVRPSSNEVHVSANNFAKNCDVVITCLLRFYFYLHCWNGMNTGFAVHKLWINLHQSMGTMQKMPE